MNIDNTTLTKAGNLSDDANCTGLSVAPAAVLSLADNGGPTQTQALSEISRACDAAASAYRQFVDKRGLLRGISCDLGTYRFGMPHTVFLPLSTC